MQEAEALENAGACSIVLECVPDHLAADVSARLRIPTIGIGSGPRCDGQVLVSYDLLGLTAKSPSFVKRYAQLNTAVTDAVKSYVNDIKKNA